MRIVEFHPGEYRNLPGLPLYFTADSATKPDNACSIRFLVGRNGTGKTNILRFLTSIFMALDEDFRRPRPDSPAYSVPFRLIYQLRGDTITIHSTGQGRSGVQFALNGEVRAAGDFPDRERILPQTVLIYTSGDIAAWQVFVQTTAEADEDIDVTPLPETLRLEDEVQPGVHQALDADTDDQVATSESALETGDTAARSLRRIELVEPRHLKLALLAALLDHQVKQARAQAIDAAFATILRDDVRVKLLSFSLQIDPNEQVILRLPSSQRAALSQLYDLATVRLQYWDLQQWVFDLAELRLETGESTLNELVEKVAGNRFQFFQVLAELQRAGILREPHLVLNYQSPNAEPDDVRTLLADSLSDGEFAFLSRMALISLLHENECLFLLDEPETHFNDDWKRNLVDNIELSLTGTNSEVILTSHASITLTDAYPDEVILISHSGQENVPLTFGAEQGELLRRVYGAERSVGKRAMRIIDEALNNASTDELEKLLDQVGPGNYRFKIVREIERRAPSDQST